jgi:hypothetical protein
MIRSPMEWLREAVHASRDAGRASALANQLQASGDIHACITLVAMAAQRIMCARDCVVRCQALRQTERN